MRRILLMIFLLFLFILLNTCISVSSSGPPSGQTGMPVFPAAVTDTGQIPSAKEPARYRRLASPLTARTGSDDTGFLQNAVGFYSGLYRIKYTGSRFLIYRETEDTALALTLPGGKELNMPAMNSTVKTYNTDRFKQIVLTGKNDWAEFKAILYAYDFHPGLFRWRLEIIRKGKPPGNPEPELEFVDRTTGAKAHGLLKIYAGHAPMAAPQLYGYSKALDSTIFYWVDLTALNPFMNAARYTPSATPVRTGQRLGHNISVTDLSNLPLSKATAVYDSYLYLSPGEPADEDAMFIRYLHNLGDIYDLMAVPEDPLPDWFGMHKWNGTGAPDGIQQLTMRDLARAENWVTLNGRRYLRSYVSDTRLSAEAITQLDVYTALARYRKRFGIAPGYYSGLRAVIPDFFNPGFGPAGMFQNSGPLTITGPQERGDTWYEIGHAIKAAELSLMDPGDTELRSMTIRTGETWIDFAHTVSYRFPRFYIFNTWQGTGSEPDAGGGFAYFMMLLNDLTGKPVYIKEAQKALLALHGYGFRLSYETHMTALTASAAARLYQIKQDPVYLKIINMAAANLMRLSWLWECDYGWMKVKQKKNARWRAFIPRTFFGLNPTQQSAVITAKEQYEAWTYLTETLQRVHGKLDPTVEKLIAEFLKHTLLTIFWSLPPLLPDGAVTLYPAAYETVTKNDPSLYIPLEDLRDGWNVSGVIGQEVYGAGMTITMAALSLVEVAPGLVVYSGYPIVSIAGTEITFAGVHGTYTPVMVTGAGRVLDSRGNRVATKAYGTTLYFRAEGGNTYRLQPHNR
ncbi:MAG: hypothetical protein GXP33_10445 [Spirochaetes bacterium]|nr:hypothetical protein [Spirochaetota bacterium]